MKGYTSRERFDERRRFTAVNEEMGRVRLDADANEQARLVRTDARRRSADVAEGSPDDGFRICETHLIDPIRSLDGWGGETLQPVDEREIGAEIGLARRDPETLPHVVRVRGYTEVIRQPDQAIDLLHLPLAPYGQTGPASYAAAAVILPVKFLRPPTDDEIVNIQIVVLDANGDRHVVGPSIPGGAVTSDWMRIRLPLSELDNLPRSPDDQGSLRLMLRGWGLTDLPPRAEIFFDGLEAEDGGLGENDFVVRGGSSTLEGAGRMYANGWRVFIESDWRYRRQPYLPDPPALQRPADWQRQTHLVYLDLWERTVHAFQDEFLREPALDGEDTAFRTHKVSQIRIQLLEAGQAPVLPGATGAGLLSTNIARGDLPDRYPPENFDPCRDRCLFTENASTGEGYRGTDNLHVRLEIIAGGADPIFAWSRNNAATVAPLRGDAADGAQSVLVTSEQAAYFYAGDIVVLEDEHTRLDAQRYPPILRQLRAVDTSSGRLEFQPEGHTLPEPALLAVGGGLPRGLRRQDRAAVRRWDGVDRLVRQVRYNLPDGITFAFSGEDFRLNEYWTFTARILHPDGAAFGTVDTLTREPVHGPRHERVPLARIRWNENNREIEDLRLHFLPLHEVRQRLMELGRRRLAPGAFTVVVGDGERTFGDFDQNLAENVTGDEVLQAALDRLGLNGGTIYVRAGRYKLEHSVLVQGRSKVRIMGDGDATELVVWGAGGAFYLDRCGLDGQVSLENMHCIEQEGEHTPSGAGGLPGLGAALETIAVDGSVRSATRLTPADLTSSGGSLVELVDNLAQAVAGLRPGLGRTAASVVQTLIELRRLQRLNPGQPLEDVAPELLEVLQRLPHGVVTISDSNQVHLNRLNLRAIGRYTADGIEAPGILLTGNCRSISIRCCRIDSPAGIAAAGYGRFLTPQALILRPRSGLFLKDIDIADNEIVHWGARTGCGVRINDGLLQGLQITDNRVTGFSWGIWIEDRSESSLEASERTLVRDNQIVADEVGLRVICDGVDIEANEVRLISKAAGFRAGIQIGGHGLQIRRSWVVLPAPAADQPILGIEAGIVIGTGQDDGRTVARDCHDLEIAGNRVEGAGSNACCVGLLIGGTQPVYDARIHGNTFRSLGGAGVRAWAHAGDVGGLKIFDNRIEDVALDYPRWDSRAITELQALAPAAAARLNAGDDPRQTLEKLLQEPGSSMRPALDALLRWLESAALKGGILMSLAEDSEIYDNRIAAVGAAQMPAGLAGLEARTAGIAAVGGFDLMIRRNFIEEIRGAVATLEPPPPPAAPRPPILDFLASMGLRGGVRIPSVRDTFGSIVALRRDILAYAEGTGLQRQQLGGSIYGAMEAVEAALEERGTEGGRLARELSDGIDQMRAAQSYPDHTQAANQVRAVLSDAAGLTAAEKKVAAAWILAAGFDHAIAAGKAAIVEFAENVLQNAPDHLLGLEDIGVDLAASAQAVVNSPQSKPAQLQLARDLGILAEAREREIALKNAMPAEGLTDKDQTLLNGMVKLMDERLDVADPGNMQEEELKSLEKGATTLVSQLRDLHADYAIRLEQNFDAIKKAGGKPTPAEVDALKATLGAVMKLAQDPASGSKVAAADLETPKAREKAELIILSAEQLDRRLGGLAVDVPSSATRELRVLSKTAGQLANMVAAEPSLKELAREVERNIELALRDPDNRIQHQAAARDKLRQIQTEQSRLQGVKVSIAEPQPAVFERDINQRLAGMGQLLLELRNPRNAQYRQEGAQLFEDHVHQAGEQLELKPSVREGLLRTLPKASAALSRPKDAADVPAALYALAEVLSRLSLYASKGPQAGSTEKALWVINSALLRALDAGAGDTDRVSSTKQWVAHNSQTLSGSVVGRFKAAADLGDIIQAVHLGLAGITRIKPIVVDDDDVQILPVKVPQPADGIFAAGVQGRLGWLENSIAQVRLGAALLGSEAHVLAPPLSDPNLVVKVQDNQLTGAAVAGLVLRPEATATAAVTGNHLMGCGGLNAPQNAAYGQSIMEIDGRGELFLSGNLLHDNGFQDNFLALHEVLIHWQGDIRVDGNRIRHGGSRSGGCGLLVLAGQIEADLVKRLSREPALQVEAAPELAAAVPAAADVPAAVDDLILAGLGKNAGLLKNTGVFNVGALKMQAREAQPIYDRFSAARPAILAGDFAKNTADTWLAVKDRFKNPVFEFVKRRPPMLVLPRPRTLQGALHLVNNTIAASGPALLVLADETHLLSATVVGNELESVGTAGTAYLRNTDATVFASNRCECTKEINVVVIRSGRSQVSVTGNVITGPEATLAPIPPLPLPKPVPLPRPLPKPQVPGAINLAVDLGLGTEVKIPLNTEILRQAIDASKDQTYSKSAAEAETEFKKFAVQTQWKTMDTGLLVKEELEISDGGMILKSGLPGATAPSEAARDVPAEIEKAGTSESDASLDKAQKAVENINLFLKNPALTPQTKLYGIYLSTGRSEHEAKQAVRTNMMVANGNAELALQSGVNAIYGIEYAGEKAAETTERRPLLEEILDIAIGRPEILVPAEPLEPPAPAAPPPDPRDHSLVVIGGSRVGAINNVTTAGVHVHNAGQSIEHNL